jgi:hypothetical protein
MRYSRDKETIEESPCVNAGCRMSRQFNGWIEREEPELALNIQHPLLVPPPGGVETRKILLCAAGN